MPVEPTKKVFEAPPIIKREENPRILSQKKKKKPKKQEKRESGKIDIRV